MKKLSIVMPCYNEENTVEAALDMVLNAPLSIKKEIIIVNDGSTDSSEEKILNWIGNNKDKCEIRYFKQSNGGKGAAVRTGIKNSSGDILIIQDADCEYDPCEYERCIQPILQGEVQVVYGSRARDIANRIKSSWFFYLGGLIVSFFFNLLYGTRISDEPTCYKTFDGDLIRSIDFKENGFGWEPEVTAKLLRLGFSIKDVPISYHPRKITEGKKIRLRDGFHALFLTLLFRFYQPGRAAKKIRGTENLRIVENELWFRTSLNLIFVIAVLLRLLLSLPIFVAGDEMLFCRPDSASYCFDSGSFDWGFRAPLVCFVYYLLKQLTPYAVICYGSIGIILSSLIIYPAGYLARMMGGKKASAGVAGALLWCFNVTAIGHAPLMLSDTLFAFFAAYQVFFGVRSFESKRLIDFVYCIFFGMLAALTRGINLPWIMAVAPVLALFIVRPKWKCIFALGVNIFLVMVFVFPFMYGNYKRAGVWSLEYNAYNAAIHNSSAVIAHAEKRNSNDVLLELQKKAAADNPAGTPVAEQIIYNKKLFSETVKKYPASFVITHLPQYQIMLPDVPTVSENMRLSVEGRGTLGVLREKGILAAVRHYFADGGAWLIALLSPFLLFTLIGYLSCGIFLLHSLIHFKKRWMYIILWGALSFYYIFLPGPVVMPRYHLPAMIFICGTLGFCFNALKLKFSSR